MAIDKINKINKKVLDPNDRDQQEMLPSPSRWDFIAGIALAVLVPTLETAVGVTAVLLGSRL